MIDPNTDRSKRQGSFWGTRFTEAFFYSKLLMGRYTKQKTVRFPCSKGFLERIAEMLPELEEG